MAVGEKETSKDSPESRIWRDETDGRSGVPMMRCIRWLVRVTEWQHARDTPGVYMNERNARNERVRLRYFPQIRSRKHDASRGSNTCL